MFELHYKTAFLWQKYLTKKHVTPQNRFVIAKSKKHRILKWKDKNPGIIFLTEVLTFATANIFFTAESGIYCWQSDLFSFPTLLKIQVKHQKQPLDLFCKTCVLKNLKVTISAGVILSCRVIIGLWRENRLLK